MKLAERAENYSGADIAVVCREALLRPIRRLSNSTHFRKIKNPQGDSPPDVWLACSPGEIGAKSMTLAEINADDLCEPPVSFNDMTAALATQRPTVGIKDLLAYEKYTEEFGRDGS